MLVALFDPQHVQNPEAERWFAHEHGGGWATCPITENGLVRIVGNPRYRNSPGGPERVAEMLEDIKALRGYVFWPDEISLTDRRRWREGRVMTSAQVTDCYLLALAVAREGRLVTLDRRIPAGVVKGGAGALVVVG